MLRTVVAFIFISVAFTFVAKAAACDDAEPCFPIKAGNDITCKDGLNYLCNKEDLTKFACVENAMLNPDNNTGVCACKTGYHIDGNECELNTYTVKYDGHEATGGTAPANHTCTYGESCDPANTVENNFIRTGYKFTEWCTETDEDGTGGGSCYSENKPISTTLTGANNGTVTLYAIWTRCTNTGSGQVAEWGDGCTIKECNPGYYLSGSGTGTSCTACPAGYYCPGGDQSSDNFCDGKKDGDDGSADGKCKCKAGYYCPSTGTGPGVNNNKPGDCNLPKKNTFPANIYIGICMCPGGMTSLKGERFKKKSDYKDQNPSTKNTCGDNGSTECHGCYMRGGSECSSGDCTTGDDCIGGKIDKGICTIFKDKNGSFFLPNNVYY
jgi:hypothetical protein